MHDGGAGISFERLSAFRDAFNEIIKMNQTFGPQLNQIQVKTQIPEQLAREVALCIIIKRPNNVLSMSEVAFMRGTIVLSSQDAYNEYIYYVLSQQPEKGRLGSPGCTIGNYRHFSTNAMDLDRLKKRVHQLEVESRVLLHENERYAQLGTKKRAPK